MKKQRKPTNCGPMNHSVSCCLWTMSTGDSDWPIITTPSTESASETSYETICAHVRIEPSSENFDSLAQPPTMNAYIPVEPSAKMRISAIDVSMIQPPTK